MPPIHWMIIYYWGQYTVDRSDVDESLLDDDDDDVPKSEDGLVYELWDDNCEPWTLLSHGARGSTLAAWITPQHTIVFFIKDQLNQRVATSVYHAEPLDIKTEMPQMPGDNLAAKNTYGHSQNCLKGAQQCMRANSMKGHPQHMMLCNSVTDGPSWVVWNRKVILYVP